MHLEHWWWNPVWLAEAQVVAGSCALLFAAAAIGYAWHVARRQFAMMSEQSRIVERQMALLEEQTTRSRRLEAIELSTAVRSGGVPVEEGFIIFPFGAASISITNSGGSTRWFVMNLSEENVTAVEWIMTTKVVGDAARDRIQTFDSGRIQPAPALRDWGRVTEVHHGLTEADVPCSVLLEWHLVWQSNGITRQRHGTARIRFSDALNCPSVNCDYDWYNAFISEFHRRTEPSSVHS